MPGSRLGDIGCNSIRTDGRIKGFQVPDPGEVHPPGLPGTDPGRMIP